MLIVAYMDGGAADSSSTSPSRRVCKHSARNLGASLKMRSGLCSRGCAWSEPPGHPQGGSSRSSPTAGAVQTFYTGTQQHPTLPTITVTLVGNSGNAQRETPSSRINSLLFQATVNNMKALQTHMEISVIMDYNAL